jgi:hypothetical protein
MTQVSKFVPTVSVPYWEHFKEERAGDRQCGKCFRPMGEHRWIETPDGGKALCPMVSK